MFSGKRGRDCLGTTDLSICSRWCKYFFDLPVREIRHLTDEKIDRFIHLCVAWSCVRSTAVLCQCCSTMLSLQCVSLYTVVLCQQYASSILLLYQDAVPVLCLCILYCSVSTVVLCQCCSAVSVVYFSIYTHIYSGTMLEQWYCSFTVAPCCRYTVSTNGLLQ